LKGNGAPLAVSSVNDRIRKLVQRGVIVGWVARLATGSLGLDLLAFVYFVISPLEYVAPFLAMVTALPEVQECHNTAGEWDFLLKVRVRNTTTLEALLSDWQKASPGIVRTQSVIALTSHKESSALVIRR
jgi:Lrp/AsnC family leucine-responsive transcriptional regulator